MGAVLRHYRLQSSRKTSSAFVRHLACLLLSLALVSFLLVGFCLAGFVCWISSGLSGPAILAYHPGKT